MGRKKSKPKFVKVLGTTPEGRQTCEYFRVDGRKMTPITSREYYDSGIEVRLVAKRGQKHDRKISDGGTVEVRGAGHCWPMKCEALAVHPSQVAQMNARNKRHGVNVQYCPKWGTAIIPDEGAYKKLRKLEGVRFN